MRAPTILAGFHDAGCKVAMVTAKDKLRLLLSNGLDYASGRAIAFSSERADKATKAENGIDNVTEFVGMDVPDVYSAELSEFVFAAGVKLVETFRPDVMYLSTTDYIQHKCAPGSKIANDFYAMIDGYLGRLDALGCVVVATADHGMNDKHLADGSPDVLYLEPLWKAGWARQGACHPPDHGPVCRASRCARLVRHRVRAAGQRRPASSASSGPLPVSNGR